MITQHPVIYSGSRSFLSSGFSKPVLFDRSSVRSARVGYPSAVFRNGGVPGKRNASNKCTADELHYVSVPKSDWRLALWRYLPSSQAEPRNHPLLLLSGVGTNATGYDLSPESSFARFMSAQGFDTWVLELRGAGLSGQGVGLLNEKDSAIGTGHDGDLSSTLQSAINLDASADFKTSMVSGDKKHHKSKSASNIFEAYRLLSERLASFLDEGLVEARKPSAIARQIRDLSQKIRNSIQGSQLSVTSPFSELQERLSTSVEDFQKQLDIIINYDWDFDHYLEEDVPAAMEYIRNVSESKDGKLLAIGHSMGGILLYAILSKCCFEGRDSGFASVTTLGSSLDYTTSRSSLKRLLPLVEPAQTLNVPVVPLGGLLSRAHPFASYPPYILSWLAPQISFPDMMQPELYEKLVLKNFETVPVKLLLQLATAFQDGGLSDRKKTFFYKDHLGKNKVPVLALAGDQDLICPPDAVYETVKVFPQHLMTYKVIGEADGPHYGHYDLVGSRLAANKVYPCIIEFLNRHDRS